MNKANVPVKSIMAALALVASTVAAIAAAPLLLTYQGVLMDNGVPVNGPYDFRWQLYPTLTNGAPYGTNIVTENVAVSNGLFNVLLDLQPLIAGHDPMEFLHAEMYLGIEGRPYIGPNPPDPPPWEPFTARQRLLPVPFALHADKATTASNFLGTVGGGQLLGTYPGLLVFNNPSNQFFGRGAGLTELNAANLTQGTISDARLSSNVVLQVQNVVFGNVAASGEVAAAGDLVGGRLRAGSYNLLTGPSGVIAGGQFNQVTAPFGAVLSGQSNVVASDYSVICGGMGNVDLGHFNFIGDGTENSIESDNMFDVIAGGHLNRIRGGARGCAISGGGTNLIGRNCRFSVIGGGVVNTNDTTADYSVIGGGSGNAVHTNADWDVIAGGNGNTVGTYASWSAIGGGSGNTVQPEAQYATIAGGYHNTIHTNVVYSTIGGGNANGAWAPKATIGGGDVNIIAALCGTIGGGSGNAIDMTADYATVAGGLNNWVWSGAAAAAVGGGSANVIGASSDHAVIAGGAGNEIMSSSPGATLVGGSQNLISWGAPASTIGGGEQNVIGSAGSATIADGTGNTIETAAHYSAIGGGVHNTIQPDAAWASLGGGYWNMVSNNAGCATLSGGAWNQIHSNARYCTIGGGAWNEIQRNAQYATIPGGDHNVAGGTYSFAAGRRARATRQGSFVWADSTDLNLSASADNEFTVRASGGVRFFSNGGATIGVGLAAGGNAWSALSDRNLKENFKPVNARAVLEKVAALPVTEWNLKSQPASVRHLGPMAQDFQAAFGLGEDDRYISTSDADGVALAAIQGLDQKVEAEVAGLRAENAALKHELSELKHLVISLKEKLNGDAQ
jgi:hypothetical protein